jgi:surfeit locus 1 family protein
MRRLPIIPTLIVALAVPAMVVLGIWQLQRAEWKAGLLARLAANAEAPVIAKPADLTTGRDALSFRRVHTVCREIRPWPPSAARAVSGRAGYRQQIWCHEGDGEPLLVSLGVAPNPATQIAVAPGARFTGPLVPRDDRDADAPPFVLIAETPVPPLAPEAPPTPDAIPDNHRAYAVQWFLFAVVLVGIYGFWLRQRAD